MPARGEFRFTRGEDVTLLIPLDTPSPLGGKPLEFQVLNRFGGASGLIVKTCNSGFNGVSGLAVVNSGQGQLQADIWSPDTSGWVPKSYVYQVDDLSSGVRSRISEGFLVVDP